MAWFGGGPTGPPRVHPESTHGPSQVGDRRSDPRGFGSAVRRGAAEAFEVRAAGGRGWGLGAALRRIAGGGPGGGLDSCGDRLEGRPVPVTKVGSNTAGERTWDFLLKKHQKGTTFDHIFLFF